MKAELRGAAPGAPQRMTVIVKQASSVKQSLLQITDVSQWGSPRDVARLLLVPGAQVLSSGSFTVPVPPRDTRTLAGVVERAPITIYRCAGGGGGRGNGGGGLEWGRQGLGPGA